METDDKVKELQERLDHANRNRREVWLNEHLYLYEDNEVITLLQDSHGSY